MRINLEPCLEVVKKYWDNVQGAIAHVKGALAPLVVRQPDCSRFTPCSKRSRAKGKNVVTTDVSRWFTWARKHPSSNRPPHKQWCIRLHSLAVDVRSEDAKLSIAAVM
ncbi:hypothetical protein [Fischerella sp. PCC 9605]|uniref:hypothetical protein n=1 Tax=Fischerella sp. PCC 9605 TaxID=1173024 RepID=UPI0012DC9C8F|nr:hypothetical protein [Fischerella sp. PCC 9605]